MEYTSAVVQENFDAEAPALFATDCTPVLMDIRLTQRNVILVRDGVSYSNPQSVHFTTNMTYTDLAGIEGNDLVDLRGWVSVEVAMKPKE